MRKPDLTTRIAVTGAGIICSIGRNKDEVWRSICESRDGIGKLTRFNGERFGTDIAAEVQADIEPLLPIRKREAKRLSRSDLLAIIAASLKRNLTPEERAACGVALIDATSASRGQSKATP